MDRERMDKMFRRKNYLFEYCTLQMFLNVKERPDKNDVNVKSDVSRYRQNTPHTKLPSYFLLFLDINLFSIFCLNKKCQTSFKMNKFHSIYQIHGISYSLLTYCYLYHSIFLYDIITSTTNSAHMQTKM